MTKIWKLYQDSFSGLPRSIWLISLITFINRAGMMVMPFLTLYFTTNGGLSADQAAWLLLSFGAGSLVSSYVGGIASDHFGSIRVMAFSLGSAGIFFLFFPLLSGFTSWLVGCFTLAFLADLTRPAIMTAVAENAPDHLQARSFALLRVAIHAGLSFGPAVGGLLASVNYALLFFVDGATCLLAALMVPWLLKEAWHRKPQPKTSDIPIGGGKATPWHDVPFLVLMFAVFLLALVIFQFMGTYPLHLKEIYSLSERQIGILFAVNAICLALFEMPIVHKLEKLNPMVILAAGCMVLCAGWAILPLGSTMTFALFSMAIFTLGEVFTLPFSNTIVAHRAGNAKGAYMGVYSTAVALGVMVAPSLGLFVYEAWDPTWFWFSLFGLGAILTVICGVLTRYFQQPVHTSEDDPTSAESSVAIV